MTDLSKRNRQKTLNILFQKACEDGDLNKASYYLESPKLESHASLHADKNMALTLACENKHTHIINYIIASQLFKKDRVEKALVDSILIQYRD